MRYRAGIIGCGQIARSHAAAWRAVPGVGLVALADTQPGALADFARAFDVPAEHCYVDYRQMLDREGLDIVSVCSWHAQHAELPIAAAARAPGAIVCEQPMPLP